MLLTHSWFPADCLQPEVRPCRSLLSWCCSFHLATGSQASGPCGWTTVRWKHKQLMKHVRAHHNSYKIVTLLQGPSTTCRSSFDPHPWMQLRATQHLNLIRSALLPLRHTLTLISPCWNKGLPRQRRAGTRCDSPLLCPFLLLLPSLFCPLISFLSSPRQPSANWLSKGRQGAPAADEVFISRHSLPLNTARGIISSGHLLPSWKGPLRWRSFSYFVCCCCVGG